jgi:peptide/nickel transport system substrate-binding protein
LFFEVEISLYFWKQQRPAQSVVRTINSCTAEILQPMNFRLTFFLLSIACGSSILLSSCGEGSSAPNLVAGREASDLVIRQEAEPDVLNPICTGSGYATNVFMHIFLPLMEYHPRTLEYVPVLVKGEPEVREVTEGPYTGGVRYTYEFLEEARWDDGTPVTAADYAFTVKAALNPLVEGNRWRGYLSSIKQVEADPVNPKRFSVTVFPEFAGSLLTSSNFLIYPAHVYDADGLLDNIDIGQLSDADAASALAAENPGLAGFAEAFNSEKFAREPGFVQGCGPYALEAWETGQYITLSKKQDWWGEALASERDILAAYPEKLIFKTIPDPATTAAMLKSQEIDLVFLPPSRELIDIRENDLTREHYEVIETETDEIYWVPMNTRSQVLQDRRVRKAIAHLMDVDQMLEELSFGMGQRLIGPIPPSRATYHDGLPLIDFSVEKAVALLDSAGWIDSDGNGIRDKEIDGNQVELKVRYFTSSGSAVGKPAGLLLKENARQAGVDVDVQYKEFKVIQRNWAERDYDLSPARMRLSPAPFDPNQRYHTSSDRPDGSNIMGFGNAESDAVIEKIRYAEGEERQQAYLDFQEIVYREQPAIFLYSPVNAVIVHNRFDAWASSRRPGYFPQYFRLSGSN